VTHHVVIVGAGPTGMMLGAELALAGVDFVIVERRPHPQLESSRAGGLHARTLEVLDQRGVGDRFVAQGKPMQVMSFGAPLDISGFPTRRPYALALFQNRIEAIMAEWIAELGVTIQRGCEVTGFSDDGAGVDVTLADGRTLRTDYLVGCDGGRSSVRRAAGIEFPGWDAATRSLIAEAKIADESEVGKLRSDERGVYAIGKLDDGYARIVVREDDLTRAADPTQAELSAAMVAVWGSDFGLHDARWISRFTDATRQAASYRSGRVLLAGDAAHVHSPVGGQGLNTGVQDAVNLGFKLAQVIKGTSSDALLDTYHAERHPVGARVLQRTMALTVLNRGDPRSKALQATVAELMQIESAHDLVAGMQSGLDIRYDFGEGHPLLGRRMPDLDLGERHVYEFLHEARPVLLSFGAPLDGAIDAVYEGPWELPVIGSVPAPSAVFVRPDGHVAWVGEGSDAGLADALRAWS
jgi:2-polyprenyl-6-methoxyphenol hydroxylase-like FAD-dependent oxidoreductase